MSSISMTRRSHSLRLTRLERGPNATLSATVMCGNRAYCWNTVLTLRLYGGTRLDVGAFEEYATGSWLLEAGDHLQRRRLAAARRPEHGEELAAVDAEVGGVDGHEGAELLAHVVEDDDVVPFDCQRAAVSHAALP